MLPAIWSFLSFGECFSKFRWTNVNESQCIIQPDLEFSAYTLTLQIAVDAIQCTLPLSRQLLRPTFGRSEAETAMNSTNYCIAKTNRMNAIFPTFPTKLKVLLIHSTLI